MDQTPAGEPILNIVGEKVALGPLRRDLLPAYQRWINDFEVVRTLALRMWPMTAEAEQAWYDGAAVDSGRASFTVYERATLRPIGSTSLFNIDHQHRRAEFGIMIGAKDCWGKGYGAETTRLMLRYGFDALDLHNIMLWVHSDNERGIRAYLRAGFREIGRRRQALRRDGQVFDMVLMDCLATEFRKGEEPVEARSERRIRRPSSTASRPPAASPPRSAPP